MCVIMPLRFLSNTMETPHYIRVLIRVEKMNRCQWGGSKFCCFIPAVWKMVSGGRYNAREMKRVRAGSRSKTSHGSLAVMEQCFSLYWVTGGICWRLKLTSIEWISCFPSLLFLSPSRYPSISSLCSVIQCMLVLTEVCNP